MSPDLVYRTSRSRLWHWPKNSGFGTVSACQSWSLDEPRGLPPVSVDVRDRCTGPACRARWDAWLRATLIGALSDWNARLLAEAEAREVAA